MAGKKRDFTEIAHDVFMQATGQAPKRTTTPKQVSGRKGGLTGGKARMSKLTEAERKKLAQDAAAARWHKDAPATEAGAVKVEKGSS